MCSRSNPRFLKRIKLSILIFTSLIYSIYAQAKTDLVFIVDGSGSINASDWNIQRQGIIAALQDPLVLPRDGSISVTVIQFASSASVMFPYTLIDSEADAQNAISTVQSMRQFRGSTGPGNGINTATSHLIANNAIESDFQSYCMSTDGNRNTGATLATSVATAKASSFVADRYSVIAIEDPPFFLAADANANYGPHVFGDGAVFVVNSFTEFAGFVGSLCLGEPLKLVGMEVTQVIQDLENSVKLIEKKKTLVRTYLEPKTGTAPVRATARLKGTRNGTDLPGSPLTALNSGSSIVAKANALDRRENLSDSLNFQLPDSWLTGTVTLELEGVGGTLECAEGAGPTANDCASTVTFNPGSELEVKLVKVKYKRGSTSIAPTNSEINELERRLLATFPTSKIDRTTGTLDISASGNPLAVDVNSSLNLMRFMDFCWSIFNCERLYYGAVDQTGRLRFGTGFTGGLADGIPGASSTGVIRDGNDYGRNRHGHEIAHTMGRHHASNAAIVGTSNGFELGACGAVSRASAPNFPNIFTVNGTTRATIGPMNSGDNKLIYGWDSQRNTVVDPTQTFAMMSYCGSFRWPSDYTYEGIRNIINSNFSAASIAPSVTSVQTNQLSVSVANQSWTVVRGIIDTALDTMIFQPVATFELDASIMPPMPSGNDYVLIVKDILGVELARKEFSPTIISADEETGDPGTPETPTSLGIALIPVLSNPLAHSYEVVKASNDVIIGSLVASDNAPTVSVQFPNGGEILNPPEATFTWSASDDDNDPLSFVVQFSKDNGLTWDTLVTDYADTTLTVNLGDLGETTQGLLRVQASDGFFTSEDVSDAVFITPNTAPTCDITAPLNGSSFVGVQPIVLEAFTFDTEEGTAGNVQWSSSINGNIGNGTSLITQLGNGSVDGVTQLSEGTHTITMTCTDGGGLTDSDTVTIDVSLIQQQIKGDADNDGDVDRNDLILLRQDLNLPTDGSQCGSKCDMNDDAIINALDMRLLVLACTRPRCSIN